MKIESPDMRSKPALLDIPYIHVFLFALYAVLSLFLANMDQVPFFTIVRPLVFALGFALIVLLASLLLFRRGGKAAVFASLLVLLFLSYGRILSLLETQPAIGPVIGRHRFVMPVWILLFALGTYPIIRSRSRMANLNRALNIVSLFLVVLMLGQMGLFYATHSQSRRAPDAAAGASSAAAASAGQTGTRPDVYYIVLDAYARQDVLKERHGVDNSAFIQGLRDMGFSVMDCAQSNYAWTSLSMSSSLNMSYIDALGVNADPNADDVNGWDYMPLLQHSGVLQQFEALGYRTVTFRPVYSWMDIPDSDVYIDQENTASFADRQESNNFHALFLRTTAMRLLLETEENHPEIFADIPAPVLNVFLPKASLLSSRHFKQYEQNLYALEQLENMPALPGPKFVYAHLFVTHQPYTFNLDGSMRWPPVESEEGYTIQVQYASQRIAGILQSILDNSTVPPVIILQSDHSYYYDQSRVKILNAYYLPGGADALYPAITPVNTFRLVFNTYFGADYPLLEDVSYYSAKESPYRFETIPNTCLETANR